MPDPVPGKVGLSLLFINGQRKDGLYFDPKAAVADIAAQLMSEWPTDITVDKPAHASQIRLLHLGRFMEGPGGIGVEHKLPVGENTIIHVVIKSPLAPDADAPESPAPKETGPGSSSGSGCCTVM
ncbi:hypothetical protein BC828DRAFT_404492 [Blastocladiella britannica]|nr:hypothetical protein BC828DRAFT_404492 [Blastocladiella britannica]